MPKFMVIVKANEQSEAGVMPSEQTLAGEHDAGPGQLLVVAAHRGEGLLARHDAGLGLLVRLDDDHELGHLDLLRSIGFLPYTSNERAPIRQAGWPL